MPVSPSFELAPITGTVPAEAHPLPTYWEWREAVTKYLGYTREGCQGTRWWQETPDSRKAELAAPHKAVIDRANGYHDNVAPCPERELGGDPDPMCADGEIPLWGWWGWRYPMAGAPPEECPPVPENPGWRQSEGNRWWRWDTGHTPRPSPGAPPPARVGTRLTAGDLVIGDV